MDSVETLSAQWKRLCTKLRLQGTALNKFQQDYPKDSMMCLDLALMEWLKMNYNHQKYGRPTWKRLAKAVGELDYRLFKVREVGIGLEWGGGGGGGGGYK